MRSTIASIAAPAVLFLVGNVNCWSDLGHRTVALLAKKYMSFETIQSLDDILENDRGYTFDDAAVWADTIKRGKKARPWTKPWHYIDVIDVGEDKDRAPTGCKLHYPADCDAQGKDGCIISAISNQTALFLDSSSDTTVRKEALMFLMHFFGDLHQPLHIEDAFRGGNEIHACFRKRCADNNLHSIWDSYIPNKITGMKDGAPNDVEKEYAAEWAEKLFVMNQQAGISASAECSDVSNPNSCSLKWARETNTWICKYVMQPNVEWLESNDLSLEYFDGAAPIVEELIGKAGARLGSWLNALHGSMITETEGIAKHQNQEVLEHGKLEI